MFAGDKIQHHVLSDCKVADMACVIMYSRAMSMSCTAAPQCYLQHHSDAFPNRDEAESGRISNGGILCIQAPCVSSLAAPSLFLDR